MPIILYSVNIASPPARAAETVVKILNLDVEIRCLDPLKNEHREAWFEKINPARQLPVLDDNGFILTDSHAIIAYLFNAYAPKDILEQYYPTDPKKRAIVESRLHFETEALYAKNKAILRPLLLLRISEAVPLEKTECLIESIDILEKILEGETWIAGDRLTIADISTVTTIDISGLLVPLEHYKNVTAWAKRVRKTCPFYEEVNKERVDNFGVIADELDYDADDRWERIKNKRSIN